MLTIFASCRYSFVLSFSPRLVKIKLTLFCPRNSFSVFRFSMIFCNSSNESSSIHCVSSIIKITFPSLPFSSFLHNAVSVSAMILAISSTSAFFDCPSSPASSRTPRAPAPAAPMAPCTIFPAGLLASSSAFFAGLEKRLTFKTSARAWANGS